jgi:drug/metabolite transporter (DMT)-like permease
VVSLLLALAASVSWGVSDFLGGLNSRRMAQSAVLLVSQTVGLAMLLPIAIVHGPPQLDEQSIAFAVAGSAAGLVGIAALYRGMAIGSISIVAPISATGAVLPVLFGLLRGERATPLQSLGIALALVGVVLAARAPRDSSTPGGFRLASGVGLALLAALGFGGFFVLLHEASTGDVLWAAVVQRLTGVCLLLGLALARRSLATPAWRLLPGLVIIGVLDTAANVLYASASVLGLVSLAAVLASLYPVVTVLLARVVLAERLSLSQGLGVLCALVGAGAIAAP